MKKDKYYSPEKIKKIFQLYIDEYDFDITPDEYNTFCKSIICLPKEKVDKVNNEIFFVILSNERDGNGSQPACYLNLKGKSKNIENKKAIIFLSPLLFDCNKVIFPYKYVLHEIAHHFFYTMDIEIMKIAKKRIRKQMNRLKSG